MILEISRNYINSNNSRIYEISVILMGKVFGVIISVRERIWIYKMIWTQNLDVRSINTFRRSCRAVITNRKGKIGFCRILGHSKYSGIIRKYVILEEV